MFITTAGRTNLVMINKAISIATKLQIPYIIRNKKSVAALQTENKADCIVVGKTQMELYPRGEADPFFFHPNSAMFRIKRLMNGEHDPFIEAAQLEDGMSVLDCTLGLASDSIVASFVVGSNGSVIGTEANKYLAYLVKEGLLKWDSEVPEMNSAMQRITVFNSNSFDFLKSQETNSFDVVYFDPMFEEPVLESDGIKALSRFAARDDLTESLIEAALRVAKCRVILKDHFRSDRFEKYRFTPIRRKSAKFHFGILEKC